MTGRGILTAIGVAFFGIVLGVLIGFWGQPKFEAFKSAKIKEVMAQFAPPPPVVSTTTASLEPWQPELAAVGTVKAAKGADLATQVAGIVSTINFESGADVKAGTLLMALQSADDVARLESLRASAALAKLTLERDKRQLQAQAISQQQVDTDTQNLKSAEAQVAQQEALLSYKSIRAPFDGRLGIRQVDLGQYVAAGAAVVTLQALDPVYVDFYLPQQALDRLKIDQAVTADIDTFPGQSFAGKISAINPKVDPATRNVLVRASFPNPDKKLVPGMFAQMHIAVGTPEKLVTLPQTAISYNPYGDTVYIVDDKGKTPDGKPNLVARQSFVTTGITRGDLVSILKGVKEGETVVVAGQLKLHNGSVVTINNDRALKADAKPKIQEQ